MSPFPDSQRIRVRKIGFLCCRSKKATDCSKLTKSMPSILNWTALEKRVDYQCYSVFGRAVGNKVHIWSLCRLYRGKYFDGTRELWILDKHIWVLLFRRNPSLHVEAPIWQVKLDDVGVNIGLSDPRNRSIERRVSRGWESNMLFSLPVSQDCGQPQKLCRVKVQKGSTGYLLFSIITY